MVSFPGCQGCAPAPCCRTGAALPVRRLVRRVTSGHGPFTIGTTASLPCPDHYPDATADPVRKLTQTFGTLAIVALLAPLAAVPAADTAQFDRAVALARAGNVNQAIELFKQLTSEHPDWPEPYNNLAVLYARQGRYAEAGAALEAALATHPSYSAAHKNLNQVYDIMASRAYQKAFALDKPDDAHGPELTLLDNVDGAAAPRMAAATEATTASAPAVAPVKEPPPASTPSAIALTNSVPIAASPPAAVSTPPPATVPSAPVSTRDEAPAIRDTVTGWAAAWSSQDVDAYLGFYGTDFTPPGGMDRRSWADQRRQRVSNPGHIQVTLANLEISQVTADTAVVEFIQSYDSDGFSGSARKQLRLKRYDQDWRIISEQVLR